MLTVVAGPGKTKGKIFSWPDPQVRMIGSRLEFYFDGRKKWIPAVYHDTIRRKLIEAAAQPGHRKLDWGDGAALAPDDITSFRPDYQDWDARTATESTLPRKED